MNIYDVSKKAGVSIATVSRVINGSSTVSVKTRQKVLGVMEELNYTPNIFARGLGTNSMNTIGIMCTESSDFYQADAIYFLEQSLRSYGYDCILCCTGYEHETKESYMQLLLSKRVDAVILVGSTYIEEAKEAREYIHQAAKSIPIFLINAHLEGENIYSACCDDKKAMQEATSLLLDQKKKDLLFLYNTNSFSCKKKLEGYHAALMARDIPIRKELIIKVSNDIKLTKLLLTQKYEKGLHFDGVIAAEDFLAIAALKFALSFHLSVPEAFGIVGYNNSKLAICCEPELTSVDNKVQDICSFTINNLIKVLDGETGISYTKLPGTLKVRGTTGHEPIIPA